MSETSHSRDEEWRATHARIRELLVRHGRNALQGGDYYLIEKDSGTYEQKVLVFFKDVLSPDLLQAISDSLWDYSRRWRVAFVGANTDGTEVIPAAGLTVSAYGPESPKPVNISPQEDSETRALYDSLSQLLEARGTSDAFGNGDYWIVDDSWTPRSHKICIFEIEFLTPRLVEEVQQLLKRQFPTAVIWFQIEVAEAGVPMPMPGIRVFADRIEHDWDRAKLQSIFKNRFSW